MRRRKRPGFVRARALPGLRKLIKEVVQGLTSRLRRRCWACQHRATLWSTTQRRVAPEAATAEEAVRQSPLTLGGHHSPQEVDQFTFEANTPIALATASSSPASSVHFP